MDPFQPLVSTADLKITLLQELFATGQVKQDLSYDNDFDALMLLFAPNDRELVVHYLDQHIALLYRAEDYKIVGLQVEAFEHSFIPLT